MPALGLTQAVYLYQLWLSKRQECSSPTIKELLSSITSICNNPEGFSLFHKQRIVQIKHEKHQLLTQSQQGSAFVYKHLKSSLSFNSKESGGGEVSRAHLTARPGFLPHLQGTDTAPEVSLI